MPYGQSELLITHFFASTQTREVPETLPVTCDGMTPLDHRHSQPPDPRADVAQRSIFGRRRCCLVALVSRIYDAQMQPGFRRAAVVGSLFLLIVGAGVAASDGRWLLEAGASHVVVSGVRSFEVPAYKLRQNDRKHVPAGYLRVGRLLGERWSAGLAYSRYGTMRGSGASGDADIFDRAEVAAQVIVPLEITDKISELSLDVCRSWQLTPRIVFETGPVLSLFLSSAELGSSYFGNNAPDQPLQRFYNRIATFREHDLRLGAAASMNFALTSRWSAGVTYRLSAPPDRHLHCWGIATHWQL